MKLCIQVSSLLLLAGVAFAVDSNIHLSEKKFEAEFHKIYLDPASEKKAAAALAKAEEQINKENKLFNEGKATFFEELNSFSDLPKDVFENTKEGDLTKTGTRYYFGDFTPDESEWYTHPELERLYQNIDRQDVPDFYDGVAQGLVTSVKNQMNCGSCAAFAVTGVHESCMLKSKARFNGLDLSEQYLMDCGYNGGSMNGCHGADTPQYGVFFAETLKGRSSHEFAYPYLNNEPKLTCPTNVSMYNSGAYVSEGYPDYECTEDRLKILVSTYGAAVTSIYASDPGFRNYADGVLSSCAQERTNHAVLVTGYGKDEATGLDYWVIRNSWGTNWGKDGYIKLVRGKSACSIGKKCYAAKCLPTTEPLSEIPIMPPAPEIPAQLECDITKRWGALTGNFVLTKKKEVLRITCLDGKCTPTVAGPSNACMYICGKLKC